MMSVKRTITTVTAMPAVPTSLAVSGVPVTLATAAQESEETAQV